MDDSQGAPVNTSSVPQNETGNEAQTPQAAQPSDEVSEHKLYAIIGYILPFLFFLPLLSESSKHNAFARFHANQQLLLLLLVVGLYVIHNVLFIVFMAGGFFIMQLLNLAVLVLAILGIVNAVQGEMKELPLIGKFRLLK